MIGNGNAAGTAFSAALSPQLQRTSNEDQVCDKREAVAIVGTLPLVLNATLKAADFNQFRIQSGTLSGQSSVGPLLHTTKIELLGGATVRWVDLDKLKLEAGAKPMKVDLRGEFVFAGKVSNRLPSAGAFAFLQMDDRLRHIASFRCRAAIRSSSDRSELWSLRAWRSFSDVRNGSFATNSSASRISAKLGDSAFQLGTLPSEIGQHLRNAQLAESE